MKMITVLAALVFLVGCSASVLPKPVSGVDAAERAWAAMESIPGDSKTIARLMELKKLRVEQIASDGRQVWRVMRTDLPPEGVFVPVRESRPTDAIAAPPQTPWVVAVDVLTGEIVWKHRNATR